MRGGSEEDGVKELLGMELGYRESTESWSGVLRSPRNRGMDAPLLAVGATVFDVKAR